MKFMTFEYKNKIQLGVLNKDEDCVYPISMCQLDFADMNQLIESINDKQMNQLQELVMSGEPGILLELVKKKAPIPVPKQDIICLGINYLAHAEESARYKKETFEKDRDYAVYFSKRVNEALGDGDIIDAHNHIVDRLDYECELAVVIRKDAKNVAKDEVFDYIFGYTILNDISARDLQTRHKQWYFGKSLDGFTPMGPYIVTPQELDYPPVVSICCRVNGELRQSSTTDLMITTISDAVSELSQGMTLKAGTIISMGTPAGVGMGFDPPRFLNKGDLIECEIEGLGCLSNTIG